MALALLLLKNNSRRISIVSCSRYCLLCEFMFQTEERVTTKSSSPGCLRPRFTITRRDTCLRDLNPVVAFCLQLHRTKERTQLPGVLTRRGFYQHPLVTKLVALSPGNTAILRTARLSLASRRNRCFCICDRNWCLPEQRECAPPRTSKYECAIAC